MVCQLCYVPYSKSNNYSKLCKLGIVTAYMSVRLSVCLYCIKMHKVSITVTSSTDNLKTIFFANFRIIAKFERTKTRVGRYELAIFDLYAAISPKQTKASINH